MMLPPSFERHACHYFAMMRREARARLPLATPLIATFLRRRILLMPPRYHADAADVSCRWLPIYCHFDAAYYFIRRFAIFTPRHLRQMLHY
jgi:hypothetical protein